MNRQNIVEGDVVLQHQARTVAVAAVARARRSQALQQQPVLLALLHTKLQSGGSARDSEKQRSDVSISLYRKARY